ncbi:phospholipase C, phosphocholine-specific [Singulisphaera sp. Ch08]|uniref:phospholipase C n=1 Tax=Singulisphaera sp. Ch08 TaxID=3120278 RepID=A0AAU7CHE2_9BACT
MDTRRDFIKKAMLLSGAVGWNGSPFESIARAAAIEPAPGSTYADAEHVVILMQENRSFDHCFGTLKGVRGFNDPRAVRLANGNPVWLQSNAAGETYAPFRFDIRGTNITWLGSTPHSRSDQVDAHNGGKFDRWIDVKKVSAKGAERMPMTMGYYTREDVPFNYALADAFTVCDQNFCSAMTSTTPNRFYLWSGTVRGEQNGDAKAYIRNDVPYGEAHWTTFPEVLEKHGVSWKVYQNELTAGGGFSGEARSWLSNFGDNPLEELSQFNVRFSPRYVAGLKAQTEQLPGEIEKLKAVLARPLPEAGDTAEAKKAFDKARQTLDKAKKDIAKKEDVLRQAQDELKKWSRENFEQLSGEARNLYEKAFSTNVGDPDQHQLTSLSYEANGKKRELKIPKGDILHQFRQDVNSGTLPAVSWLVAPANFSDHPSTPWYGSWYVSEVIDILTKNPEVWKKTIFILNYDENDGYFDHIPPFTAPDPAKPETGKCSPGIDTGVEFIRRAQELAHGVAEKEAREGPTGLGYRVPMVIASPWSRGGRVCSQVFDHTSVFRFVQDWLGKKTGKQITENTISLWRKTVCGDLTSAFRPFDASADRKLATLEKTPFIKGIYDAKFQPLPSNYRMLTADEIAKTVNDPRTSPHLPQQEPGVKPSNALPYQLYADARLSDDRKTLSVGLEARNEVFGARSAGSPFNIFTPVKYAAAGADGKQAAFEHVGSRSYAVIAGDRLTDSWPVASFENGLYHLRVCGPNGFYREHRGSANDPALLIECDYERTPADASKLTGNIALLVKTTDARKSYDVIIKDHAYGAEPIRQTIAAGSAPTKIVINPYRGQGWYDFSLLVQGFEEFEKRLAGRVETGAEGITDPYMGRLV